MRVSICGQHNRGWGSRLGGGRGGAPASGFLRMGPVSPSSPEEEQRGRQREGTPMHSALQKSDSEKNPIIRSISLYLIKSIAQPQNYRAIRLFPPSSPQASSRDSDLRGCGHVRRLSFLLWHQSPISGGRDRLRCATSLAWGDRRHGRGTARGRGHPRACPLVSPLRPRKEARTSSAIRLLRHRHFLLAPAGPYQIPDAQDDGPSADMTAQAAAVGVEPSPRRAQHRVLPSWLRGPFAATPKRQVPS